MAKKMPYYVKHPQFIFVTAIELHPGDYAVIEKNHDHDDGGPFMIFHAGEETVSNLRTIEEVSGYIFGKYGVKMDEQRPERYLQQTYTEYPYHTTWDIITANDLWVTEWSAAQQCLHVEKVWDMLKANRFIASNNTGTDYIPIGLFKSSKEAHQCADVFKRSHHALDDFEKADPSSPRVKPQPAAKRGANNG